MRPTSMPRPALTYLWIVLGCGAIAACLAAAQWTPPQWPATVLCVGLGIWASLFKVRLPGFTVTVSPGFVIVLVAVENLDLAPTLLVGLACALVQTFWRAASRPHWTRTSFNLSTMAIASCLAHTLSHAMAGSMDRMGALAVAGMALQVMNTLIVATMICLMRGEPLKSVWRSVQFWTLPYYFAGGIVASLWSLQASALATPLCLTVAVFLMHTFYREYVERYRAATADSS